MPGMVVEAEAWALLQPCSPQWHTALCGGTRHSVAPLRTSSATIPPGRSAVMSEMEM